MPPPETLNSEIGSQPTMCQVHTGAYVSIVLPLPTAASADTQPLTGMEQAIRIITKTRTTSKVSIVAVVESPWTGSTYYLVVLVPCYPVCRLLLLANVADTNSWSCHTNKGSRQPIPNTRMNNRRAVGLQGLLSPMRDKNWRQVPGGRGDDTCDHGLSRSWKVEVWGKKKSWWGHAEKALLF